MNLAITNTGGGGARPPVVQRSERGGLEGTASGRGPEGRASRARERRKAATEEKKTACQLDPELNWRDARYRKRPEVVRCVGTHLLNILSDDDERSVLGRREVG